MNELVTVQRLIDDLKKAGIKRGDRLVVHSSLKSIGMTRDGADTVIDALMDVIGEEGTIFMPVFTYSYEREGKTDPFNRKDSPSLTGIITETFRKRSGVLRSSHPTHSMAVWGKNKEGYIKGHDEKSPPFTENSPLYKMVKDNGKILLLGVTHKANSTVHVIEYMADVPYLKIKYSDSFRNHALIREDNATVIKIVLPEIHAGCSRAFDIIDTIFNDYQNEVYIGNAKSLIMNTQDLANVLIPILKRDPAFLLCEGRNGCNCQRKRELVSEYRKERDLNK